MQVVEQEFDPAIPVADLNEHPDNPRRGDDAVVAESVETIGFFGAILVHRATKNVIAGNTRLRVARAEGADAVPGFWVDCDDETARRILLADNRASDLATYDDDLLMVNLRAMLETDLGLLGTGYSQATYELLLQQSSGDDIYGGVRQGLTPEDRSAAYADADIRSIILPFSGPDFERVVPMFAAMRSSLGVDTNAAVVDHLLTEATAGIDVFEAGEA